MADEEEGAGGGESSGSGKKKKIIKAEAAQIFLSKTTNETKVQGFGCKVLK